MVSEQFYQIFKYQPDIRNIIFEHQKDIVLDETINMSNKMRKYMNILQMFVCCEMKIKRLKSCYRRNGNPPIEGFESVFRDDSLWDDSDKFIFSGKICKEYMADLHKLSKDLADRLLYPINRQIFWNCVYNLDFTGINDRRISHIDPAYEFWTKCFPKLCKKYKLNYKLGN